MFFSSSLKSSAVNFIQDLLRRSPEARRYANFLFKLLKSICRDLIQQPARHLGSLCCCALPRCSWFLSASQRALQGAHWSPCTVTALVEGAALLCARSRCSTLSFLLAPADMRAGGGSCCLSTSEMHSISCDDSASTEHTYATDHPGCLLPGTAPLRQHIAPHAMHTPPQAHHVYTVMPAGPFAPLCTPHSSRRQPPVAWRQAFQATVPC